MLFQIATVCGLALERNLKCVIAWWDQDWFRSQRVIVDGSFDAFYTSYHLYVSFCIDEGQRTTNAKQYLVFGGMPPPAPGITLKHIFPNLLQTSFEPKFRNVWQASAFTLVVASDDRCDIEIRLRSRSSKRRGTRLSGFQIRCTRTKCMVTSLM